MKKKLIRILTVIALLAAMPVNVYAETFSGGDGWSVVFDGTRMESTFRSADIDDAVYQLQPGDDVNIHLSLSNTYSGATDWYMSNEVLRSLEDAQTVAEGGAYSYLLTYIDTDGNSTVLFDSDEVGGETVNESGEGLYQATDSLEDFFYLDRLNSGDSGEITLNVQLEGETQGNAYQDTWARLQMNFAVELVTTNPTVNAGTTGSTGTTVSQTRTSGQVVKTGDDSRTVMFAVITLVAGLVCLTSAVVIMQRRKKEAM